MKIDYCLHGIDRLCIVRDDRDDWSSVVPYCSEITTLVYLDPVQNVVVATGVL